MGVDHFYNLPTFYPQKCGISQATCIFCIVTDGENIFLSGSNGTIQVWKVHSDKPSRILKGHKDLVTSMILLRDKNLLSSSDDGFIINWDTKANVGVTKYSGSDKSLSTCIAFYDRSLASMLNTDAGYVVIGGSWDHNLYIWNPRIAKPSRTLSGHSAPVKSVVVIESKAGPRIASGATNGEICIWDLKTFTILNRISAHLETVSNLKFHEDYLVSSGQDGKVRFWDVNSLEIKREFTTEDAPARKFLIFRKNFVIILAGVKTVEIWNLKTQRITEKRESKDIVSEVTVMDDNKVLIARRNEINILKYINKKVTSIQAIHRFRMEQRYPPIVVKLIYDSLFNSN